VVPKTLGHHLGFERGQPTKSINQSINQSISLIQATWPIRTRETDEQTESSRQEEQHNTTKLTKNMWRKTEKTDAYNTIVD